MCTRTFGTSVHPVSIHQFSCFTNTLLNEPVDQKLKSLKLWREFDSLQTTNDSLSETSSLWFLKHTTGFGSSGLFGSGCSTQTHVDVQK